MKTLTVVDDAYESLKRAKAGKESFSDVIRRLTKRSNILVCAGLWGDLAPEELRKMKQARSQMRRYSSEIKDKKVRIE